MAPSISDFPETSRNEPEHDPVGDEAEVIYTEFLIVGAGPAGASLACFLGSYGELGQSKYQIRVHI